MSAGVHIKCERSARVTSLGNLNLKKDPQFRRRCVLVYEPIYEYAIQNFGFQKIPSAPIKPLRTNS